MKKICFVENMFTFHTLQTWKQYNFHAISHDTEGYHIVIIMIGSVFGVLVQNYRILYHKSKE